MTGRVFVVIAAVVLLVLLGVAAVAVASSDTGAMSDQRVDGWTPTVPDVHGVEPPDEAGVARVDDHAYESIAAADEAATPGDTIVLDGRFDERVTIETPEVTIAATERDGALIDGNGTGTVLTVNASNVTLDGLWIRNSGYDRTDDDAGVLVRGSGSTLTDLRLTEVTFGIYVADATEVHVEGSQIAGRAELAASERANGIHLWRANRATIRNNSLTTVRDGIYYSYSDRVLAEENVMWDLRYGVHYMYSDHNRFQRNVAFDNDVGFALMVSRNLTIVDNVAVNNDGQSSHGILVKDVDHSELRGNAVVANGNGLYVYNSNRNEIVDNLILENRRGIHITAGSQGERVVGNSFINNEEAAYTTSNTQVAWNGSDRGNYWSDAKTVDLDGDGTSEIRHQPAGVVERLLHENPQAQAFTESPAFDAVRLAESSFPVVESPGIVDHRPLAEPPHANWRRYYADHGN